MQSFTSKKGLVYSIRQAVLNDFENGLYDCLSELSLIKYNKQKLREAFLERNQTGCIFTYVAYIEDARYQEVDQRWIRYLVPPTTIEYEWVDYDRVIGTVSLFLERKFLHDTKSVGHIEDVVVKKEYRGHGIGEQLVKFMVDFAKGFDAYKVVLNCNSDNTQFYEKCGFRQHEVGMRLDIG